MGLRLPKSYFFHIPKTGGNWVMRSLEAALPEEPEIIEVYERDQVLLDGIHHPPDRADTDGLCTFTFVRHPLTWWQSIWTYYKQDLSWIKDSHPIKECYDEEFDIFITNILNKYPGYYSLLVKKFEDVDFVGNMEEFPFSLADALDFCNEEYGFDRFLSQHVNTSSYNSSVDYRGWQERAIMETEDYVISKYYGGK